MKINLLITTQVKHPDGTLTPPITIIGHSLVLNILRLLAGIISSGFTIDDWPIRKTSGAWQVCVGTAGYQGNCLNNIPIIRCGNGLTPPSPLDYTIESELGANGATGRLEGYTFPYYWITWTTGILNDSGDPWLVSEVVLEVLLRYNAGINPTILARDAIIPTQTVPNGSTFVISYTLQFAPTD